MEKNIQFERLIKGIQSSHVQGLFVFMFLKGKNMNDVAAETGITRQTLSTWKKGGNITHKNVERVAEQYQIDAHLLYDAKSVIEKLIADCPDHVIRGQYGEYLAEYTYLENAYAKPHEL
jgi:transcriptional regulator with XRE-family HTH domain